MLKRTVKILIIMLMILFGSFMFTKTQAGWANTKSYGPISTSACGNKKHPSGCIKYAVPGRTDDGGVTIHVKGLGQQTQGNLSIVTEKGLYCLEHSTSTSLSKQARKNTMFS